MANYYDSYIRCITNPELFKLIDPNLLIHKTPSKFLCRHFDELIYETRRYTMHRDIITFSQTFPKDVFMARYFDIEVHIPNPAECYRYKNGQGEFMGYEPVYKFSDHDHLYDTMGKETLLKLWFRVRDYIHRLDHTKESLIDGEYDYVDMLEDHFDYCVSSSVTIHAEVDNFKLTVDKTRCAELFFRGFKRESESNPWVEILPDSDDQFPF